MGTKTRGDFKWWVVLIMRGVLVPKNRCKETICSPYIRWKIPKIETSNRNIDWRKLIWSLTTSLQSVWGNHYEYWRRYDLLAKWLPGHLTTVFCKVSVRRSKNCLEFSIAWGRLKISRWPFHSCTIFVLFCCHRNRRNSARMWEKSTEG